MPAVRRPVRLAVTTALVVLTAIAAAPPVAATVTPATTAGQLADAMEVDPSLATGASYVAVPASGTPHAVGDNNPALAGFPRDGSTYAILTSGNANLADDPNTSGSSGASLGAAAIRGGALDATILKVDVSVPAAHDCLTIDFRFLSEEFPEYVGSAFNDAFIAELDTNDWSISSGVITAPNNFAFDESNQPITINSTGAVGMSAENASGTTYDGATPLLEASTPLDNSVTTDHSLYLSIFDQGDNAYDSAVFIDALTTGTAGEGGCEEGAVLPVSGVDLTTLDPETPPGVQDAGLDSLPANKIPQQTPPDETAPIGRAPIGRAPIGRAPIGRAPIGRAPIGRAPIGRAPIGRAPIGRAPIGRALLASFPLNVPGGWTEILQATQNFKAATPQGVTLFQLFNDPFATDGDPGTLPQLDPTCVGDTLPAACNGVRALSLADFNVAGSPLENVSLLAFLLGTLTWDDVAAPAAGWCSEWTQVTSIPCDTTRTIFDSAAEGVPIDQTSLPLRTVGEITGDAGKTKAVFWSLTTADLNIGAPYCDAPIDCNAVTTTLADIGAPLNAATLSDIVLMVVDPVALEWEQLPLQDAGFEGYDEGEPTNFVRYRLAFEVGCPVATGLTATVGIPPSFRYRPGSSTASVNGGSPSPLSDPVTNDAGVLEWDLSGVSPCGAEDTAADMVVGFQAMPGFRLGMFGSSASVFADEVAPATAVDQAAVTVTDEAPGTLAAFTNTLYVGHLGAPGEKDFFDVSVPEGHTLSVTLSHLSNDYDLALYAPNGADTTGLLRGPSKVVQIAGGALATDPPDPAAGVLAPPALEGISLEPGRVVAGISSLRGTEQEGVTTTAVAGTGGNTTYRVQVSGHNGAFGNDPYVVIVRDVEAYGIPQCIANTLPSSGGTTSASFPTDTGDKETLYIVDEGALRDAYGDTPAEIILTALTELAGTPEGDGLVVPVDANGAANTALDVYRSDPCSVEKANTAVREVNDAIDSLSGLNSVENIVLVGDDSIFPHAGLADGTVDGNESGFTGDLVFSTGAGEARSNHLTAVLADNRFLADTPYAAARPLSVLGQIVYVPQWGFGRLAGSAEDILGAIQRFRDSNGAADPSSAVSAPRRALETDYDFMTDGGQEIFNRLQSQVGQSNAVRLFGNWTRADFLNQFLQASTKPHVVSANAHYDQYRMLPGLGNATGDLSSLVTTDDVSTATGLAYRILFSIGCHFALGVPNSYAPNQQDAARAFDWAEAYAQKGVAAMIGNLGYGYGDTATIGFDERLMADLAQNLDGSMSIGAGLNKAEQDYFSSASALSPYDFKVLQQTVLWGFPMYSPTGPVATASAASPLSLSAPVPDSSTGGLSTTSVSLSPTFTKRTVSGGRSFYEADGLAEALHPYPVMPKVVEGLPAGPVGEVAHGAVPLSLTRTEEAIDIAFANATIDSSSLEPATAYETVYPLTSRIGTTVSATGDPSQNLVVIPGEFASDDNTSNSPSLGTFGKYTSSNWLVTYGPANGEFTPPEIRDVFVEPTASFTISARVTDDSGLKRVFAQVLKADGTFEKVELSGPAGDGVFTGTSSVTSIRGVSIYAVDGVGNTAAAHDKQLGFGVVTHGDDTTKPLIQIFTPPSPPAIYDVNETVTEQYTCTDEPNPDPTCTDSNGGTTLDTSSTGSKLFTVTSTDAAGNTSKVTHTYDVRFEGFQGLFSPVNALPTVNVAKAGQTVPLRWRILDANGQPITNASHFVSVTSAVFGTCAGVSDPIETFPGGSGLQYLGDGNWQFNWKTKKQWSGSCREVVVNLADGTDEGRGYVAAQFTFK